jgi:hypothetical protein
MAWKDELTIMVRTLVNDIGETYTYSDERIQQVIVVAAKYVQFDVVLDNTYTVNVSVPDISPDPTDNNDDIFIALVSLKAACIVDQSTFRTKSAMEGVRASLGPASLSVAGQSAAWRTMLELGPCAAYDELTSHWDVKEATAIRAVLSPFVGNKFDPRSINTYIDPRARDFYR